jgi:hypothetical protein
MYISSMCFIFGLVVFACAVYLPTDAGEVGQYSVYDDATWAVVSSKVTFSNRQKEYQSFMDACRSSAGKQAYHLCDRDEAHRMQMNMYQPRSVRLSVSGRMELAEMFFNDFASWP